MLLHDILVIVRQERINDEAHAVLARNILSPLVGSNDGYPVRRDGEVPKAYFSISK